VDNYHEKREWTIIMKGGIDNHNEGWVGVGGESGKLKHHEIGGREWEITMEEEGSG